MWIHKLQVIQNSAIRNIFYLPYDTPSELLNDIANDFNLKDVKQRMFEINQNIFSKTINYSNPLIVQFIDEYKRGFDGGRKIFTPTPLCASKVDIDAFFESAHIYENKEQT